MLLYDGWFASSDGHREEKFQSSPRAKSTKHCTRHWEKRNLSEAEVEVSLSHVYPENVKQGNCSAYLHVFCHCRPEVFHGSMLSCTSAVLQNRMVCVIRKPDAFEKKPDWSHTAQDHFLSFKSLLAWKCCTELKKKHFSSQVLSSVPISKYRFPPLSSIQNWNK